MLFFIKLIVAIILVVGLSLLAENVSPKIAGVLTGYPTGTAITLFFFGLEVSPEFASESAVYNMLGLTASLCVMFTYYLASKHFEKHSILFSALLSVLAYFVVVWLLHFINLNKAIAVAIPVIFSVLFSYLFRNIEDVKIHNKVKLSYSTLLMRSFFAATMILLITFLPRFVGAEWSGLFSAFPTTTFPLLLIIHFTYSKKEVHTIIKNVPTGIFSLIFFSLTVSIVYPLYGIYIGTLIAFTMATLYLIIYRKIIKKFRK